MSEVEPILLRRVKQDEPREEDEAPEAERENVPVEDEADVEGGADEQLGREADEDVEREVEEAGTYKLVIQFVVGGDLEIMALCPSSASAAKSAQPLRSSSRAAMSGRRLRHYRST